MRRKCQNDWTTEEINLLRELYPTTKSSDLEIILHKTGDTIRHKASELHIKPNYYKRFISEKINKDELTQLYCIEHLSSKDISKIKNVTDSTVLNWLLKFNIPVRTASMATSFSHQKHEYSLRGPKSPFWKGDKSGVPGGYQMIRIYSDNPYFDMAEKSDRDYRWIFEHRLVMAKHLGRLLNRYEVVHHVNGIKDDNRIENLELFPSQADGHLSITFLKMQVSELEKEVKLLKFQVKTLTDRLNNSNIEIYESTLSN